MIANRRNVSNLSGFNATESVYNVPDVDPLYQPGSSQYDGIMPNEGQFQTTSQQQEESPGFIDDPFAWRDRKIQGWLSWLPWVDDPEPSQDGKESNEGPVDSPTKSNPDDNSELLAVGAVLLIVGVYAYTRKGK